MDISRPGRDRHLVRRGRDGRLRASGGTANGLRSVGRPALKVFGDRSYLVELAVAPTLVLSVGDTELASGAAATSWFIR